MIFCSWKVAIAFLVAILTAALGALAQVLAYLHLV